MVRTMRSESKDMLQCPHGVPGQILDTAACQAQQELKTHHLYFAQLLLYLPAPHNKQC